MADQQPGTDSPGKITIDQILKTQNNIEREGDPGGE